MAGINGNFKPSKAGSPRQGGQIAEGNGSLSRSSAIAQQPEMPSTKGEVGAMPSQYLPAKAEGSKQSFKPSKSGGVR